MKNIVIKHKSVNKYAGIIDLTYYYMCYDVYNAYNKINMVYYLHLNYTISFVV